MVSSLIHPRRVARFVHGIAALGACCAALSIMPARASSAAPPETFPSQDALIQEAREAHRKRDGKRLEALREQAVSNHHPLASWVDYWQQSLRLGSATVADLESFYGRWPQTYVEDRLRNDWLLELGRRKAWAEFLADLPRFRLNDDREVHCYAIAAEQALGRNTAGLAARAQAAWAAQREADEGCHAMARQLLQAKVWDERALWHRIQGSLEANRLKAARQAAALLDAPTFRGLQELWDKPAQLLDAKKRWTWISKPLEPRLAALALVRLAHQAPAEAAQRLDERWGGRMSPALRAWTWAQIGRQAGLQGQLDAHQHYRRAWEARDQGDASEPWSDDVLAWGVRAALRQGDALSWHTVLRATQAMGAAAQDPTWRYWRAQALLHTAKSGASGQEQRESAQKVLGDLASPLHFYGKLALEELGRPVQWPSAPAPLSASERQAALEHPGLTRALRLMAIGLRAEGVREWNFSITGMDDRSLLAAAQRACDREVWDRCINTSERTRAEVDLQQRFPTPFRQEVLGKTQEIGVDPAYVYGLIRQESRFITDARSHVGAAGLMQVMPATARWTAKRIGMDFKPEMATDREANMRLGMSYLKVVLDDFGGSQAMAAAGYNAGPGRPRRWREGPTVQAAAWAESIPIHETRDYVKKVLSNATVYSAVLGQTTVSLKARLGATVGPASGTGPGPAPSKTADTGVPTSAPQE